MPSAAVLRTRTGCLECRRRRKKCDETRPRCTGCARNRLACVWPAQFQPADRRRRHHHHSRCLSGAAVPLSPQTPQTALEPAVLPAPFDRAAHARLLHYGAATVLPAVVRPGARARYRDHAYVLGLAVQCAPLLGALLAVTASRVARGDAAFVPRGVAAYRTALALLRDGLARGCWAGDEDSLLATTVWLGIWENCQPDGAPQTPLHIRAAGTLLRLRQPKPRAAPPAALAFERVCVESFVYHAALLALFFPAFDPLADRRVRARAVAALHHDHHYHHDTTTTTTTTTTTQQPILDLPFRVFLLAAAATRLARAAVSSADADADHHRAALGLLRADLRRWTPVLRRAATALYVPALTALLHARDGACLAACLRDGLAAIAGARGLRIDPDFIYFHLWPVAVLAALALTPAERAPFRDAVARLVVDGREVLGCWALRRLQAVWDAVDREGEGDAETDGSRLLGLRRLLEGEAVSRERVC
ncbi:hypothetical protein LOZ66_005836 [Ophidiomyces ophidiicola]|nr:hypothetical protein LOZ66_005836 [Ophidiomyces ophidiicola]